MTDPAMASELDPERLLKREFFYHLPSVALVIVVAWPVVDHAVTCGWAVLILSLVKVEHAWAMKEGRHSRWRTSLSFALTLAISACYALAAGALVSRHSPSAALFSFILLTSSLIGVLLRYFHKPWMLLGAAAPQAFILAVIGYGLVAGNLQSGRNVEALAPAATMALFVLLFWATRDQLDKMHKAQTSATAAAFERERAARAASQAKSEFLATVSHEIRTPLNGVLGMAQAMTSDTLAAVQRERVQIIRRCGESLLAIVDDVLDLSKIESGKLELESVPFDLEETARGAAATFAAVAEAKGLTFEFVIDEDAQGRFLGDPTRVRQVLHNLVSNAVKFTPAGWVRVRLSLDQGALSVAVADSGIGISSEDRDRLFDKFVQADSSTTRRFGGSGLGLAITRELVHAMGGGIQVVSALEQGSTFKVWLPLKRLSAPHPEAEFTRVPEIDGGLRVLAAEDNAVNQQVLKVILGQAGLTPVIAGNGREAVEAWECSEFDIVLMDVQMPEMDGLAATRAIRAREAATGRRRTPILALTANAMTHQALEYQAAGMDGLAAKPIDIEKLFTAIQQAMSAPGAGWERAAAAS
jgi:signal transduction histidine kinase/ActR/RegA family two-component response regulator